MIVLTWVTPPVRGVIGRVALAAAAVRTCPGRAIEWHRRIQVDRAIEVGPVLVHVVRSDEQAAHHFALARRWT
jgi:hypothetical protein